MRRALAIGKHVSSVSWRVEELEYSIPSDFKVILFTWSYFWVDRLLNNKLFWYWRLIFTMTIFLCLEDRLYHVVAEITLKCIHLSWFDSLLSCFHQQEDCRISLKYEGLLFAQGMQDFLNDFLWLNGLGCTELLSHSVF